MMILPNLDIHQNENILHDNNGEEEVAEEDFSVDWVES
jgi:hypothetical protein